MLLNEKQKQVFDASRKANGFLTVDQVLELAATNTVLDPFSLIISQDTKIGINNTFMPNVFLKCSGSGKLQIGDGNTFHSNTSFEATTGPILVGNENTFGEGTIIVKSNAPNAEIEIGNEGRYAGQINVFGNSNLGNGSQVLGNISIYSCQLAGGKPHTFADPDERAAVIKGSGIARGIEISVGKVMNGQGNFDVPIECQSAYHPRVRT